MSQDHQAHSRPVNRRHRNALIGCVVAVICAAVVVAVKMPRSDSLRSSSVASTSTIVSLLPANTPARKTTTTSKRTTSTSTTAPAPTTEQSTTTSTIALTPDTNLANQDSFAPGIASLSGRIVVIDPGHNGGNGAHPEIIDQLVQAGGFTKACDTTGTETNAGYPEFAFTFDVSTRLAALLRADGAQVFLTHTSDSGVGPCVNERAAIGNEHNADAAISIHADGGPPGGRGFHVLAPAGCNGCENSIVTPSAALADDLRDTFRAETPMPISDYLGTNGIFSRSDLGGLNLSTVPKVFIECGNMRNNTDAALLEDPSFRQTAAVAIADGIARYLLQH